MRQRGGGRSDELGEPLLHPELRRSSPSPSAGHEDLHHDKRHAAPKRSDELLAAESLHKISVSLHSFEGNDGADEQELTYLTQVWNFAEKAAKKGVIVALRLWNDGGADARNGEILDFCAPTQAITGPRCETAAFFCATTCIWSARASSTGPT